MTYNMSWDDYFMKLARAVSEKSKDRSTKVGCIIVGPDNEIRSTGFNGFPRGAIDDIEARHQRPEKYEWTEHAERNAIYNAARHGVKLLGCRAFLTWLPCMACARAIVQSGIIEVVGVERRLDDPVWARDFDRMRELFNECGVRLRFPPMEV